MTEPKTRPEALRLSKTMAERRDIAQGWANEYRARGKKKQAAQMEELVRQFQHDASTLFALAATLPE